MGLLLPHYQEHFESTRSVIGLRTIGHYYGETHGNISKRGLFYTGLFYKGPNKR